MVTEEKLTGRALNDEVAIKVMDWHRETVDAGDSRGPFENWIDAEGVGQYEPREFEPSASFEHVTAVEERIEELGLELKYATALLEATGTQYQASLPVVVWSVIRATPEERCWAALAAIDKTKGDTK